MGQEMQDISSLAPKFPGHIGDQATVIPGVGLVCDQWDDQQDQRFALSRYASFTFWGVAVGANASIIFAPVTLSLFDQGAAASGDAGSAATGIGVVTAASNSITTVLALTDAETNTDRQGAFARTAGFFMVQGYGIELQQPATYQTDGSIQVDPVALFYAPRAINALYYATDVQSKYQDSRCFRRDGKLKDFPCPNQLKGGDNITVGQPVTGLFTPLQYPYFVSGRNTSNQIDINLKLDRQVTVLNDTNQPTGANFVLQIPGDFYCFGVQWCPGAVQAVMQSSGLNNPDLAQLK